MNYEGVHLHTAMDFLAKLLQAFGRAVAGLQAEIFADFVAFLFVQPEDDVEIFLESGDQFQRAENVFAGAFLRIGEVYEELCVETPWQKGDLIALDNMLVAHARRPFAGERKIVVAMGRMTHADDLSVAA